MLEGSQPYILLATVAGFSNRNPVTGGDQWRLSPHRFTNTERRFGTILSAVLAMKSLNGLVYMRAIPPFEMWVCGQDL